MTKLGLILAFRRALAASTLLFFAIAALLNFDGKVPFTKIYLVVGDDKALFELLEEVKSNPDPEICKGLRSIPTEYLVGVVGLETSSILHAKEACYRQVAASEVNADFCDLIYFDRVFGYLDYAFARDCRRAVVGSE